MDSLSEQLRERWHSLVSEGQLPLFAISALLVIAFVCLLGLLWRRIRRRGKQELPPLINPYLDLASLSLPPLASNGMHLEVYGTPVQIAVIVLASVGRDAPMPATGDVFNLVDQLIPNFAAVALRDQPLVRIWESQLSSKGFANAFAKRVPLPGDRGKGTPWCSIMGKFTANGLPHLIGIIGYSLEKNPLSQYFVQHEGQWNDILRVRRS